MKFDIILKYFAGKATPEEAMQVDDWANAAAENKEFLSQTHASWLAAGNESYHVPDISSEWERLQSQIKPQNVAELKPGKYAWLGRVAAFLAIIVTAFAGYYLFNTKNQNLPTLTAEAGGKRIELSLKDGSHVGIEPQGALVYPVAFAKDIRQVTLVGDGSFDVNHEPSRPFYVHMGQLHIKVLGTSFAVNRDKKAVTVTVSKGLVAFYNDKDTLLIPAGNIGKYINDDKKFVLSPIVGTFLFNNTPMHEVAAQLSAHFKVDIRFNNAAFKDCRLSAGFENQTLKEILTEISATFNTEYKTEGNVVQLSGNACK